MLSSEVNSVNGLPRNFDGVTALRKFTYRNRENGINYNFTILI